jgi:hypothetical protein
MRQATQIWNRRLPQVKAKIAAMITATIKATNGCRLGC